MACVSSDAFRHCLKGSQAFVGKVDRDTVAGRNPATEATRRGAHVAFGTVHVEGKADNGSFGAPLGNDSIEGVPMRLAISRSDLH